MVPRRTGAKSFPTEGGQRYLLTSLEALLFYPSVSIAYGKEDSFGVGVTLQLVMAPSLEMGLVVDGSQAGGLNAYYSGNDVLATISMSDMLSFSAIFGAWWRPIPALELGVSGRVVPAFLQFDGEFTLSNVPGQTQFSEQQLSVPGSRAQMDLTIPPTAKVGARYRHLDGEREVFDVEVNLVYEAWSLVERYDVHLDGTINLFVGAEAPDTVIEKRWRDTLSVRLGGTWNVIASESDFPSSVGDLPAEPRRLLRDRRRARGLRAPRLHVVRSLRPGVRGGRPGRAGAPEARVCARLSTAWSTSASARSTNSARWTRARSAATAVPAGRGCPRTRASSSRASTCSRSGSSSGSEVGKSVGTLPDARVVGLPDGASEMRFELV